MLPAEAIARFCDALRSSIKSNTFARLRLSQPATTAGTAERVTVRMVDLRGQSALAFSERRGTQDLHHNRPVAEGLAWIERHVGRDYRHALLQTTQHDWQFHAQSATHALWTRHPAASREPPARAHDRQRATLLDDAASDWLAALGVTDRAGNVRARMASKHRQIHRYLELLDHLTSGPAWIRGAGGRQPELRFVDMGCGKAYLTFGAWHLFRRARNQPVRVLGVDQRADLVERSNAIARAIGADGLEFAVGAITDAPIDHADAVVALHACDTATDDAIARGIALRARLIVVAPCCHREVRASMGTAAGGAAAGGRMTGAMARELLHPIMRHGLMTERLAEWLTDGLRALYLERAGYRTTLMEFVASEHTPKNLLLAGVRSATAETQRHAAAAITALKRAFGLGALALDKRLQSSASDA